MIIVYPVSHNDQDLALKNVRWWNELGGCRGHQVLYCWDQRVTTANREAIEAELNLAFDHVHLHPAGARVDGWPEGANYMFRINTAWLATRHRDIPFFMWMEPDAIPLAPDWADIVEKEFREVAVKQGKFFMGDMVDVKTEEGEIPLHMSGIGVYQNPVYIHAGEAYRAFDIAWDMAAREQIVPNAYFTELIEHAWKHPTFHSMAEMRTQISPKTILFHSSKDGSLIDLARQKRGGHAVIIGQGAGLPSGAPPSPLPSPNGLSGREVGATSLPPQPRSEVYAGSSPVQATPMRDTTGAVLPGSPVAVPYHMSPTTDIFIRTYPGDYQWLDYCLQSIAKFAKGFRKIWVVSPAPPSDPLKLLLQGFGGQAEWKVMNDETEDGYLAQQITKLYADVITDYQADNILIIDSDTLFTRPVTPADFFDAEGRLVWYYTDYNAIQTPWQPITEKFMGEKIPFEFMRRLPMMIPRWLYPKLREFCHQRHSVIISDYIRNQPPRAFSEFNALGAYAFKSHYDQFHWVDTLTMATLAPVARQFHSWGGITPEVKDEINKILDIKPALNSPDGAIKELPDGTWVLSDDTHVSKWIEQEGRLDHDQNSLPQILELINEGDTVVDAGAFVGDHTLAYVRKAGIKGIVHAFEPNPLAFQCLEHNISEAQFYQVALGDKEGTALLSGNNGNAGGAYLGEHMPVGEVKVKPLDDYNLNPDFIKLDVEGCEVKALIGMEKTLRRCKPRMVIEVNEEALRRQGNTVGQLLALLESHDYKWRVMQENCVPGDPLYDIIALPAVTAAPPEPKVKVAPLTPKGEMIQHVEWLGQYIKNRNDRLQVMYYLRQHNVVLPTKKK